MTGRRIAWEVLLRVDEGGAFANAALDAAIESAGALDPRERGLATELVYGTLRRALALDWSLAQRSSRPLETLQPGVRAALRLGAYQLLHLRVPDHAAVSETVDLCRAVGLGRASGFVNAVLRAVAAGRGEDLAPPFEVDPALHLRITEGLPEWLFDEWSEVLPPQEVRALAAAVNEAAPTTARAPSAEARDDAVAAGEGRATRYSPVGLVVDRLGPSGFQSQDEAAQLATLYALHPGALEIATVLDACAAPGGKTCHLAQALPAARVVAVDLHRRKADRIAAEAARLGVADRIEVHAADATHPLPFAEEASFDLVLLDAPCSGLGTLRRHPEIKLRRGPADIERLAGLQATLLDNVARYVRPGGRLVYAVCTHTRAEGPGQVTAFLARHDAFERERAEGFTPELLDAEGALATWTHRHGIDGFYAVRFRRRPQ